MSETVPGIDGLSSNMAWYAVKVKSHHEQLVASSLQAKEYSTLLPLYRVQSSRRGRAHDLAKPLFPGYVFARFDVTKRLAVLITPGVVHILGVGKTPVPVEPREISNLRIIAETDVPASPWPFLKRGQRIRIHSGPLLGVEGLLVEPKRGARLVVSVDILQRSVALDIDASAVTPIGWTDFSIGADVAFQNA